MDKQHQTKDDKGHRRTDLSTFSPPLPSRVSFSPRKEGQKRKSDADTLQDPVQPAERFWICPGHECTQGRSSWQ